MTEIGTGKHFWPAIYWLFFFAISLGLGYPALNRFDPRTVPGCVDSNEYFNMVSGDRVGSWDEQLRLRPLVPWLAKPFFQISQGRIRSWNPVAFGLLISSALFTATGALLFLQFGRKYAASHSTAFAGTLLYLLNFTVHNKHLGCGLVDSGESSLLLTLYWLLFEGKFFLLPIVGLLGALSKETFIPMAAIAVLGWAIVEFRNGRWKRNQTLWSFGMIVVGLSTTVLLQFGVYDRLIWPWEFAAQLRNDPWARDVSLLQGLIGCLTDRQFWYIFGWLLPLGVLRLQRLPGAWMGASLGGAAAALAMGAWNNGEGATAPAVFNSIGPILSLSAAQLLGSGLTPAPGPATAERTLPDRS